MAFRPVGVQQVPQAQAQPQQPGGLTALARSFINPFRRSLGQGFELSRPIARKLGLADESVISSVKNPFLANEEITNLQTDPVGQTAKNYAGVAANFVPFGKGSGLFSKAILPGAGAAALSESSENDTSLGKIIKSSLFGGGTAGILQKLLGGSGSKAVSDKLDEVGGGMRKGVLNPDVPVGPTAVGKENKLFKEAGKFGLSGSAQNQRKQVNTIYNRLSDEITGVLKQKDVTAPTSIIDQVKQKIRQQGTNFVPDDPMYEKLMDREIALLQKKALNGTLKASDLFAFKNELAGKLGNAFKKQSGELQSAITPPEAVRLDLWDNIDEIITTLVPEVKELTLQQSQLHKLAPGLTRAAKEGEKAALKIPFTELKVVSKRPLQSLQDTLGRGLQGAAGLADESRPMIESDTLRNLISGFGSRTAGMLSTDNTPAPDTIPTFGEPGMVRPGMDQFSSFTEAAQPSGRPDQDQLKQLLAMGVLTGDIPASAITALETLGVMPETVDPEKAEKKSQVSRVIQTLQNLYFGQEEDAGDDLAKGRAGGIGLKVAAATGIAPRATRYNKFKQGAAGTLKDIVGETGVLTDPDIQRITGLLPDLNSTPEEATMAFEEIAALLGEK